MSLWRRVGVVIAMAVFALTVGASNVFSVDRDGRFFAVGVGKRPCSDYIKFREKKSGCESARGRARAEPYLGADVSSANFRIANPLAEGTASIAVFQLGVQDRVGVFVTGSRRSEFPTQTERLLLQVTTNQAASALQEARLIQQQLGCAIHPDDVEGIGFDLI